jgi:serine/threonine-protein kinase RsbW
MDQEFFGMTNLSQDAHEISRLSFPNDPGYVPVAVSYVDLVAQKFGMSEADRDALKSAVHEAVSNAVQHAYEPGERATIEVSCEEVVLGFKVSISDLGMPFDPSEAPMCENPLDATGTVRPGCGLTLVRQFMDEVHFLNHGSAGKELVLIKYKDNQDVTEFLEPDRTEPQPLESPHSSEKTASEKIMFRPMDPSEAIEVAKCVYRAYGRSYTTDMVYYPQRFAKLNTEGKVRSFVAVSETGEIVGHCAFISRRDSPDIAEIGIGVVKPTHRKRGIFQKVSSMAMEAARKAGLKGLYGRAVTNHTYSQRLAHHLGLRDCMILLGNLPSSTYFKGITEQLIQRETLIAHFCFFDFGAPRPVFVPNHHEDMIRKIYDNIGASHITFEPVLTTPADVPQASSVIITKVLESLGFATISVKIFGHDIVSSVRSITKELCLRHIDVIYLHLDLLDSMTSSYCSRFEELGFFFAGILPFDRGGEGLVLQYLNNVNLDYALIKAASPFSQQLLAYINAADPNVL